MKSNLPCEIIKDLLPGYIDGLSSEVTNTAVEEHLSECDMCRKVKENMLSDSGEIKQMRDIYMRKDKQLFKKIKSTLNKRTRTVIAVSVLAVIIITSSLYALFEVPLKNVDLKDVEVSVKTHPIDELETITVSKNGDGGVLISSSESDISDVYNITIPEINNSEIFVTSDTLDKTGVVSIISWSSPYLLRNISYDSEEYTSDGDTIYISAFKTTLLNNKADKYQQKMMQMEFRKINKIVFVEKDGQEIVLWENANE